MRETAGLCSDEAGICGRAFVEKYLPSQLNHFSPEGLYRDPGDPMTYDFTTRLQAAVALAFGYRGPASEALNENLCRAGYATLLYVSPDGYAPYGGRSGGVNFQEAIIAALCELEARRHRDTDPRLASAYKRQAHRSALSVRRWLLEMDPFRHLKNGFDPAANFGRDAYGHYSVYSLLAASFFGLAALFADDSIPEAPCPAEIGGYVFALPDAFHKLFATGGNTHVELDLRADAHYDATGLGRFTRTGVPLELGPGMPITATPAYLLPADLVAAQPLAIGPAWPSGEGWQALAGLSDGLQARHAVDPVYLYKKEIASIGKPAIIANVNTLRSILRLAAENQIKEGDLIAITENAANEIIVLKDLQMIESYLKEQPISLTEKDKALIEKLDAMSSTERWTFWQNEFAKCVKCYACRQACPLCYCTSCTVENNQPQWVPVASTKLGNLEWHVMRTMHLAGRCTTCGQCASACPMDIPLHLLPIKLSQGIKEIYGTVSGMSKDENCAMSTYKPEDKESFIG